MKTTFKLSALALVMALTACSSGGGSGSPSALADKAKKTVTKAEEKAKDGTEKVQDEVKGVADSAKKLVGGDEKNDEIQARTYRSGNGGVYGVFDDTIVLNQFNSGFFDEANSVNSTALVVNGVTYTLADFPNKNTLALKHSSVGYAWKDVTDTKSIVSVYASGSLTEADKVPTTGAAIYQGNAFAYSEKAGDLVDATALLQVDFAAKTVNGQISNAAYNLTETFPTAKIDGNEFFGSSENKQVRGNFFGANAEEVSGIYRNNSAVAAFGATKQ